MANYKVYNPDCDDAKKGDIGPYVHIEQLDKKTREWLERKIRMELLRQPGTLEEEFSRTYNDFTENVRQLMDGTIDGLGRTVTVEDVLDMWAVNNSFDLNNVETTEAGWLAFDNAGRQMAFAVFLANDEASPNGSSWDFFSYTWDPGENEWKSEHEGAYWGYQNAGEAEADIELPPAPTGVEWSLTRADVPFLVDELNIWNEPDKEPRKATSQEIMMSIRHPQHTGGMSPIAEGLEFTAYGDEEDPSAVEIPLEERFSAEELEELERAEIAAFEAHIEQLAIVENIKQEARAEMGHPKDVRQADVLNLRIDEMMHYESYDGQADEYDYLLGSTEIRIYRPDRTEGRCQWDLKAAGSLYKGSADSLEEALSVVKERYSEAIPPAKAGDRDAIMFPHPLDLPYDSNTKSWKWEASTNDSMSSVIASINPGIEYDDGQDYVIAMIRTAPGNDAFRTEIADDFGQAYRKLYEFACESLPVSGIEAVKGNGKAIGISEIGAKDYGKATDWAKRSAEQPPSQAVYQEHPQNLRLSR